MDPQELQGLREWIDRVDTWDLRQYLVNNVTVAQAYSMCAILVPEFVVVDGCVFAKALYDRKSYERWRDQLDGNRSAIERMINHLHLWDVLAPISDSDCMALRSMASTMGQVWRMQAHA